MRLAGIFCHDCAVLTCYRLDDTCCNRHLYRSFRIRQVRDCEVGCINTSATLFLPILSR